MRRYGRRAFGQEEIPEAVAEIIEDPTTDGRNVINKGDARLVRHFRAQEQWERYDSVVVGDGAATQARGWFNNWNNFAQAQNLQWFSGRDAGVGPSYTNQEGERTDWAQDIYQVTVQFIAPPGIADLETDPNDALNSPTLFMMLANALHLRVILSESDEIASAPADHFPSSFGQVNLLANSQATPVFSMGTNGEAIVSNSWKFPEPIMLAAKSKITVRGTIDRPILQTFMNILGPGFKNIPTGRAAPNDFILQPNWYVIRVTMRGPRYLQLRGARSSS